MRQKRTPLADKTRLFTNSLDRKTVSSITKGLFRKATRRVTGNSAKLERLFKSLSSEGLHSSSSLNTNNTIQRADKCHHDTTANVETPANKLTRVTNSFHLPKGCSRRLETVYNGLLTKQLTDKLGKISTMNAVLNYDQPIRKMDNRDNDTNIRTIENVRSISPTFHIVRLTDMKIIFLVSFQRVMVRIKPGDKLNLGEYFMRLKLKDGAIPCYYRWYKLIQGQ